VSWAFSIKDGKMHFSVYILYSEKLSKYYVGSTTYSPIERLAQHNNEKYEHSYTSKGIPWKLYFTIKCETGSQSRRIENHIKRMKSRVYIENLKSYPEIVEQLKSRYIA
jgi:putative endonuclease